MTAPPGRPRKAAVAVAEPGRAGRFAALADATRRHLLEDLAGSDRTVSELVSGLDISQAAVSQHLRVLRNAGLVAARRDGRHQLYRLRPAALTDLRDWLDELERFWQRRLTALGDYLDAGAPEADGPGPDGPGPGRPGTGHGVSGRQGAAE